MTNSRTDEGLQDIAKYNDYEEKLDEIKKKPMTAHPWQRNGSCQ